MHAQSEPTLAETINNILTNINLANVSPQWGTVYSQIFCLTNQSIFDTLIQEAVNQSDWQDAVWVARLAELNGFNSPILTDCLATALENMPMCGSLPATCNTANQTVTSYPPEVFCVYDRYMVNAYRYAQELGVLGWNMTRAFTDFADAYVSSPKGSGSRSGEMFWINPAANFSASYTGRYYDEYAETLGMFLEFALNGVRSNMTVNSLSLNATSFMDNMWGAVQDLWNGDFYDYNNMGIGLARAFDIVECEMGNFAQIAEEYQNYRGLLPYFSNVITDLEYTCLTSGWDSPIWASPGAIQHANDNSQVRLPETLAALIAIQMLYPQFNASMQTNFQSMLQTGWQGLVNSTLYSNGQFQFTAQNSTTALPEAYSDDASMLGAMTLFLDGIIPQTGSLSIAASNERYEDYQTCFPISQWQFNYQNQSIRIPVMAGTLIFTFGSQPVSQLFPSNGVYEIQFSPDWNSIASVTKVADITVPQLKPATLQTQIRPTPTPTSTSTPSPEATSAVSITPTLTSSPTGESPAIFHDLLFIAAVLTPTLLVFLAVTFYIKKKKPLATPVQVKVMGSSRKVKYVYSFIELFSR
ncbi:MAG: hypothetical protein ABSF44_11300 [Candidatus Bathyarchaeia archaeon]